MTTARGSPGTAEGAGTGAPPVCAAAASAAAPPPPPAAAAAVANHACSESGDAPSGSMAASGGSVRTSISKGRAAAAHSSAVAPVRVASSTSTLAARTAADALSARAAPGSAGRSSRYSRPRRASAAARTCVAASRTATARACTRWKSKGDGASAAAASPAASPASARSAASRGASSTASACAASIAAASRTASRSRCSSAARYAAATSSAPASSCRAAAERGGARGRRKPRYRRIAVASIVRSASPRSSDGCGSRSAAAMASAANDTGLCAAVSGSKIARIELKRPEPWPCSSSASLKAVQAADVEIVPFESASSSKRRTIDAMAGMSGASRLLRY
jgi:hypothetical protein